MLKENPERATSKPQQKELDILLQSLVLSVSKKDIFETKYCHGKINCKYFQR